MKQVARVVDGRPAHYYWAYGSNLCIAAMKERCPAAEPVGRMMMPSGRLVFRRVADVIKEVDAEVPGALWRITGACELALDGYEGVRTYRGEDVGLYNKRYVLIEIGGRRYDCLFYQMNQGYRDKPLGIFPPSEDYVGIIRQGYRDFKLPVAYLDDAIGRSWEEKAPTEDDLRRHKKKGSPTLAKHPMGTLPPVIALPAPAGSSWRDQQPYDKRGG